MDPNQNAGPADTAGPAGEHIVTKDQQATDRADQVEATMGEPGTSAADGGSATETAPAEPEVVTGEVMSDDNGGLDEAGAGATVASKPLGAGLGGLRSELDERPRGPPRGPAGYANSRKR